MIDPKDGYAMAMMRSTGATFQKLAALRGIQMTCEVNALGHYTANGVDCGESTHGLYDWLEAQPGVLPKQK